MKLPHPSRRLRSSSKKAVKGIDFPRSFRLLSWVSEWLLSRATKGRWAPVNQKGNAKGLFCSDVETGSNRA
jgi:hypothetical protein